MTNSITVSEQELKELLETGFFVRSEPKKEGDTPVYLGYNNTLSKTGPISEIWNKSGETIADVGDVFRVKNEKGEKAWFCPECGYFQTKVIGGWFCKHGGKSEPLLVRLDKIEEQKTMYINQWLKTFRRVEE